MRSKKLLPLYVLIAFLLAGFIGFYISLGMDPSNQRFAQPPEKLTPIAEFDHEARIYDVAFSPVDAALVATADKDKTIKLWNRNNPTAPQAVLAGHTKAVRSIAFSPTGELLASASSDGIVLWDIPLRKQISSLKIPVSQIAISPTGHRLASAGAHVKLWDIRNPKKIVEVETLPHDESKSGDDLVWTLDFSSDGRWLAYGDENGYLKVWDLQHKRLIKSLKTDSDNIESIRFSADNRFLINAGFYGHTLWRLPEWKLHGKIIGEWGGLDIAFSPNGKMYATPDYKGVTLRCVANGERIASLKVPVSTPRVVDFSFDGNTLAAGGKDGKLHLWNVTQQQLEKIDTAERGVVRLIYFLSQERPPQRGISRKLDTLIRQTQRFYATQMNSHGFRRKTFTFQTDARGKAKVYLVRAQHPDNYYQEDTTFKIRKELSRRFDYAKNILVTVVDIETGIFHEKAKSRTVGLGNVSGFTYSEKLNRALHGGRVFVSAAHNDLEWNTIAHELGHAFGLQHDFRGRNARIMSYKSGRYVLSKCAAEWLDKSRFFNPDQPFFDKRATIEMRSRPNVSNAATLQFEVTDEDGLHQVQLIVPTIRRDPVTEQGFKLYSCQSLNGAQKATVTFELPKMPKTSVKEIELWMIDLHGNIVWREFDLSKDSGQPSEKP